MLIGSYSHSLNSACSKISKTSRCCSTKQTVQKEKKTKRKKNLLHFQQVVLCHPTKTAFVFPAFHNSLKRFLSSHFLPQIHPTRATDLELTDNGYFRRLVAAQASAKYTRNDSRSRGGTPEMTAEAEEAF
ncbi:hypothetical protein M5689_008807 [Euphorbia peplus]|nr:hypothetical protein M5689_008807 [Euphorbia peplus]